MIAACHISMTKVGLPAKELDAIVDLLRAFELPSQLPSGIARDKILEAVPFDKKFAGGKIRFVVSPRIGSAALSSDVTLDDIRDAVERL
jgi:3-dehydroquinate synthase